MKLLIATTNKGKFEEIKDFLKTAPFEIIGLSDLNKNVDEPDEPYDNLLYNAIYKAKYYAEKTNFLTVSDDTGLFVDSLSGWPGIHSSRVAKTHAARWQTLLEKMKDIEEEKRGAEFRGALAFYNPETRELFTTEEKHRGIILKKPTDTGSNELSYDCIFYVPEKEKTHSEMTRSEKSGISWRGKALQRLKYYLDKQYGGRHIVVPLGIILNEKGQVLVSRRNDPHRQEFHGKWEFPGGSVEMGESIQDNLVREIKEEVGYTVEPFKLLQYVHTNLFSPYEGFKYQVYLPIFVCKIISGNGKSDDQEVLETKWFSAEELLSLDFLDANNTVLEKILPELITIINK